MFTCPPCTIRPFAPISAYAIELLAEHGDATPIAWVHRSQRFAEKLASPDTSMADLIGEVDPIKIAEGRYLTDELALSYGLVPRVNRGIFAINELPGALADATRRAAIAKVIADWLAANPTLAVGTGLAVVAAK